MAQANGTPKHGTTDLLSRGLALAAALASAPDVSINPPLDLPDDYPDEPPALDYDPAVAAEVFAEMDARQHLDLSECLTLPELVDRQADFYRGWNNPVGTMIAKHMEELAVRIRWVKAETPEDYDARHEIVEQDARETWRRAGYEEGLAVGRREAMPYNGPLD
jgi:hypothetical protein